jgi:nickel-dependent lactate racemase
MSAEDAWVFCGAARLPVPRADAFQPPARLDPVADLDAALEHALARPLGAPQLRRLAHGAASVAITVPDASRSCPTPEVLRHLLEEVRMAGVPDDRVCVAVGCGLHATTTAAEKERLVGRDICRRLAVVDAQGIESPTVALGDTSRGAPIRIVQAVAEADLTISVGVVEPHLYAGFSGGVKGVAIGCAGQETIAWTHRPAFVSLPGVRLGALRDNPFRDTLNEIAARTSLQWAVNVVTNEGGRAAAVATGDPALVQASLASTYGPAWLREVDGPFDVLVAGVPAPKSAGLYQASRAATYVALAAHPALAAGGLLVLCADLPDGAGDGPGERNFLDVLARATSPAELVARGLHEPLGPGGQRSFVVARVLERFRLGVVGAGDPSFLAPLERLGVTAFDSVDAAVAAAEARLGRRARVLAVADAMTTIVGAFGRDEPEGRTG